MHEISQPTPNDKPRQVWTDAEATAMEPDALQGKAVRCPVDGTMIPTRVIEEEKTGYWVACPECDNECTFEND